MKTCTKCKIEKPLDDFCKSELKHKGRVSSCNTCRSKNAKIKRSEKPITQDELKKILNYNPETGLFTWLIKKGKVKAGDIAGNVNRRGYVNIRINWKLYFAHRLAFLFMEGFMPKNLEIDHIDRNTSNNIWKNIRIISRVCNCRNCKVRSKSKSGVTGVVFYKALEKWQVHIRNNNKTIHLGYFSNIKDAAQVRWEAEIKYNYPNCCTTSSAYQYLINNPE